MGKLRPSCGSLLWVLWWCWTPYRKAFQKMSSISAGYQNMIHVGIQLSAVPFVDSSVFTLPTSSYGLASSPSTKSL